MNTFRVILETTCSGYDLNAETKTFFAKEFETKKEAMSFFRKFAKENNFQNTVFSHIKLGWYEGKQVELVRN